MIFEEFIFQKIREQRLPNIEDMQNIALQIMSKYNAFRDRIINEFGPNGFYIIILFILFLFIITIIYIKSVVDTFRAGNNARFKNSESEGLFYSYDDTQDNEIDEEEKKKRELEKEISKDLIRMSKLTNDYLHLSEEYKRLKSIMKHHAEVEYEKMQRWKQENEVKTAQDNNIISDNEESKDNKTELSSMMTMLINMLSRDVSEPKISQVLYKQYSATKTPEDIIQIVRSIKDFLSLCNTGKFDNLPNRNELPSTYEALFSLANGDNSLCLELMKNLTKNTLDVADEQEGLIQTFTFAKAANYACLAGTLAGLDDVSLAKESYILATELAPENVNAWSRMGDSLTAENNQQKAIFAYQTVLDFGDEAMYSPQIANAKKHLAQYYLKQGVTAKADTFLKESQKFYTNYGIETPLSETENATVDFLKNENEISSYLSKLLTRNDYIQ